MIRYILFIILLTSSLFANIGKISALTGDASVQRGNLTMMASLGMILHDKDIVQTKSNAKLQIIFKDRTIVTIGKNSALNIQEYLYDVKTPQNSKVNFKFFKGAFKTVTGTIGKLNKKKFILQTKTSTIGIRGTVIIGNQNVVACTLGGIHVTSNGVRVNVDANQLTRTKPNEPPTPAEPLTNDAMIGLEEGFKPDQEQENTQEKQETDNQPAQEEQNKEEQENTNDSDQNNNEENNEQQKDESTQEENQNDDGQNPPPEEGENPPPSDEQTPPPEDGNNPPPPSDEGSTPPPSDSTPPDDSFSGDGSIDGNVNGGALNDAPPPTDSTVDSSFETEVVAPPPPPPVVETTEVQAPTTLTLSGRILGFSSTTNMPGDSISLTRTGSSITLNATGIDDLIDADTFSLSGTQTFSKTFDSTYSTFSSATANLGTMTLSPSSNTYSVYSDNKGEIFVLFNDSGTSSKEMVVAGTTGSINTLNNNNVYRYNIFKELEIERTSLSAVDTSGTHTQFSTNTGSIYYNAALDSWTHFDKKSFEHGAGSYGAGYQTGMLHYDNQYDYSGSLTNHYSESSILNLNILGSEAQGLVVDIHTKNYDQITDASNPNNYSDLLVSAFMDKEATTTATTSGTYSITGLSSYLLVDNTSTPAFYHRSGTNQTVTVNINRTNGSVSGSVNSSGSPEIANLSFSGNITDKTSYYVNDDMFGSLGTTGASSNTTLAGAGNLTDQSESAFVAVADGAYVSGTFKMFDANDNPLFSNDDSSWGYWTADYGNENDAYVDPFSTWVAGVDATSAVTSLLSGTSTHTFWGKVLGYVQVGTDIHAIKMDDTTNEVKIKFDFGGGQHDIDAANSHMKFTSINDAGTTTSTWNMAMDSTAAATTSTFTGTLSGTNQTGTFDGKFFGNGSLKSVGGNFNATNSSTTNKAYGVFKATKQ